jgi:hypothetical protein
MMKNVSKQKSDFLGKPVPRSWQVRFACRRDDLANDDQNGNEYLEQGRDRPGDFYCEAVTELWSSAIRRA